MTSNQWIELLLLLFGSGSIGGALIFGLLETWRSHRDEKSKRLALELERQRNRETAEKAIADFVQETGIRELREAKERADKLETQIDVLTENQQSGKRDRDALEAKYDALEAKYNNLNTRYTESERLLKVQAGDHEKAMGSLRLDVSHLSDELTTANLKADALEGKLADLDEIHTDTLAALENAQAARVAAEDREKAALDENITLKIERTALERQMSGIQDELTQVKRHNEELTETVTSQGKRIAELEAKLPTNGISMHEINSLDEIRVEGTLTLTPTEAPPESTLPPADPPKEAL